MKLSGLTLPAGAVIGAIVLLCLYLTVDGRAMSNNSRIVLFSEVAGVVTRDGAPVEGAEIVQKVLYKSADEVPEVTSLTGVDGKFSFAEISRPKPRRWLPGEITITQSIVIHVDGVQYEGWHHGKKGDEANTELEGRPFRLVCDLSSEPDVEGNHFGICREATE